MRFSNDEVLNNSDKVPSDIAYILTKKEAGKKGKLR